MSFVIDADRVLYHLWDTLRPGDVSWASMGKELEREGGGFDRTRPGLLVTLDLRMSHFALSQEEYHRSALAYVVLTGNTSVFVATTTDFTPWHQLPGNAWENTSNHDSCWREDGFRFLNTLYFEMCEGMNAEIQAHGSSPLAPREFNQFCSLGTIAGPPWVEVLVCSTPKDDRYKRTLTRICLPGKVDYLPEITED